jgi:hypothetical protein
MRPPKHILLVGENEFTISTLRYVLNNSSPSPIGIKNATCYRVTTAMTAQEALGAIQNNDYALMLCQHYH